MKAAFIELPAFERFRREYLDDEAYRGLQRAMMTQPGKGTRGGLRVIYYWWQAGGQFWLFTLYDKNEASDLTAQERDALKTMLKRELEART